MTNVSPSVYNCLISRITSGAYPVGGIMPGCRGLAAELGVNKNTVTRAYAKLQEHGLIRNVPGVGMRVMRVPESNEEASTVDLRHELSGLIRRARAMGITRREMEVSCKGFIDRWYSGGTLSFALVECNMWDARSLASDIETRLGVSVTPMLIEDFLAKPEAVLPNYDLVVTTFYHLTEIYDAIPEVQRENFIALGDHPSVRSLLALSNIPADGKIAVVAAHERTIAQLERTLESCGRKATFTAVLSDSERVSVALSQSTVVVESQRSHAELQGLGLSADVPLVTVSFEIDPQSFAFLRKRIDRLMAREEASGE